MTDEKNVLCPCVEGYDVAKSDGGRVRVRLKEDLLYYFSGLNFLLLTPIAQPDTNHITKNDVDFRETLPLIWALSAFNCQRSVLHFFATSPPSCQPNSVVIGYLP